MCESSIDLYDCKSNILGEVYSLYDLANWKNGLAFKKIHFSENGVPVIKIAELNNGIGASTSYTNGTYSDDVHLVRGDMLFSWSGNPKTSIDVFWFALDEGWLNQHIFKVTVNEQIVYKEYFYYLLKNLKSVFQKIASNKQTTGLGHVTISDLKKIEVTVPQLYIQKKIVKLLEHLDDKIANNNEINRKLSEQAQAFYWSWFVSCENFGGKVPSNWRKAVLGDIAEIKTSTFKPTKEPDVVVEHYSIPALDEKHFPVFEIAESIKSNKYILTQNSVIISKLNPDTKRIWRPLCISDRPICSTEFIVFEAKNSRNKDYIYSIIDSTAFSNYLCSHVTGSTGSRQRAVPKATLDFELFIPTQEIIDEFCSFVTPLYDLIASNELENYRLAELRDSLLPKLMSGEIDVSNIKI